MTMSNEMDKIQELIERLTLILVKDDETAEPEVEVLPPETGAVGKKDDERTVAWPDVAQKCPKGAVAMPTELTRVSLFRLTSRRQERKVFEWEPIAARGDVEIKYFGIELDQADADVWMACLLLGREAAMGERIYTSASELLRMTGRKKSSASVRWLQKALKRLSSATFEITVRRKGRTSRITTGLLKYGSDEEGGRMFVRLDADGVALFEQLTYINWNDRLQLKSAGAKSLLTYVSSHELNKRHHVKVSKLAGWMGYSGDERFFRSRTLKTALDELEAAGIITDSKIEKSGREYVVSWTRATRAKRVK